MTALPQAHVAALVRFPVKGLTGERLDAVSLAPGDVFPMDRAFAIENGPSGFDPRAPAFLPKIRFLCLMRNARLARLSTRYDDASGRFSVREGDALLLDVDLGSPAGRDELEAFFDGFMGEEKRGPLQVLDAPGHSFSDVGKTWISIASHASARALAEVAGRDIDIRRFRANIEVEGWPAYAENELVGTTLAVGTLRMRILKRTQRCAATSVDPATAERDMDLPALLLRTYGHMDFGIYGEIVEAGEIRPGDAVRVEG